MTGMKKEEVGVFTAFVLFGLSSWIMADSFFVEVAALYRRTPEGKEISAFLIAALQASNIFPILYMLCNRNHQKLSIVKTIWFLLVTGIVVSVLLACFWDVTSIIFGQRHSTVLLVLVFFGGLVCSTTSVVFYPFVAVFPPLFTSALATGEGLSGVWSGLSGLIQDSGAPDPTKQRLSISTFFLLSGVVFAISMISFWFLTCHSWAKKVQHERYVSNAEKKEFQIATPPSETLPLIRRRKEEEEKNVQLFKLESTEGTTMFLKSIWKPLFLQVWICMFSFGIVPSILPFFGGSYINGSEVLKWSSILSMACDACGRFITSFWRLFHIHSLGSLLTLLAIFMVYQASLDSPLFVSYQYGGIFPVALNCLFSFAFAYTQTMIYLTLKKLVHGNPKYAEPAYQWAGFLTQVGGLLGTLSIFPIVSYTSFFQRN